MSRRAILFALGLVVTLLVALGLIVLFSASECASVDATSYNRFVGTFWYRSPFYLFSRQCIYCAAGLVAAVIAAVFDYRKLRDWHLMPFIYAATVVLLAAVFLFDPRKGSRRWIPLGLIDLQPSELAKIVVVLAVGVLMDKVGFRVEKAKYGLWQPLGVILFLAGLVVFEPDYGSTMVILAAGSVVMLLGGTRWRHLIPFSIIGFIGLAALVFTNPNRRARLLDQYGSSPAVVQTVAAKTPVDAKTERKKAQAAFQVGQSLAAIANGGLWGVGPGQSMQKKNYLPEKHTDFVFAIGAEELGLPLSIGTMLLFCAFLGLTLHIAATSNDRLGKYIAYGLGFIIFFQAFFNLGVICKALPTKGMALPFFSFGGTNMISSFLSVGLIFSVGIHSREDDKRSFDRIAIGSGKARP